VKNLEFAGPPDAPLSGKHSAFLARAISSASSTASFSRKMLTLTEFLAFVFTQYSVTERPALYRIEQMLASGVLVCGGRGRMWAAGVHRHRLG
jgi:hypothetical protein